MSVYGHISCILGCIVWIEFYSYFVWLECPDRTKSCQKWRGGMRCSRWGCKCIMLLYVPQNITMVAEREEQFQKHLSNSVLHEKHHNGTSHLYVVFYLQWIDTEWRNWRDRLQVFKIFPQTIVHVQIHLDVVLLSDPYGMMNELGEERRSCKTNICIIAKDQ